MAETAQVRERAIDRWNELGDDLNNLLCEFDQLAAENERLRKALTYYAEGRYPDGGETAREALHD